MLGDLHGAFFQIMYLTIACWMFSRGGFPGVESREKLRGGHLEAIPGVVFFYLQ